MIEPESKVTGRGFLSTGPHLRRNALTGEWVLVSPHRTVRPWQGEAGGAESSSRSSYDPGCYLCPGNSRAGGARNPHYRSTFVFDNDFPALRPDTPRSSIDEAGLLVARAERGVCRVVCFSPDHSLDVPAMSVEALTAVVETWAAQFEDLAAVDWIRHVQIFENRGAMMGASNPHPHCQIWASETVPNEAAKEEREQARHAGCLLCDYLALERRVGDRMIFENGDFSVLTPFWAVWPFETMVIARRHVGALPEMSPGERCALAGAMKEITTRYDRVFNAPFPYSMGLHQRRAAQHHFHAHYYPPLLRSATVRKHMVGFELLGSPQRDVTAESAAARLRELVG